MVEVAVHERLPRDVERGVELASERSELVPTRTVEPSRHVVSDPAERLRCRAPQLEPGGDRDSGRLLFRQIGDVSARALDQQRAPEPISPQQPDGAVAGPELERLPFFVGLVVLGRPHFQHPVFAGRGDVRVARERERLAQLHSPLRRHLARDPLERDEIRKVVAQRNRSTIIAIP